MRKISKHFSFQGSYLGFVIGMIITIILFPESISELTGLDMNKLMPFQSIRLNEWTPLIALIIPLICAYIGNMLVASHPKFYSINSAIRIGLIIISLPLFGVYMFGTIINLIAMIVLKAVYIF